MEMLDSPVKRAGFVVLIIGYLISLFGIYQIAVNVPATGEAFNYWVGAITLNRSGYGTFLFAGIGAWLVIAGLLLSFLYDSVTSRVVHWVMGRNQSGKQMATRQEPVALRFKSPRSALDYACKYLDNSLVEEEFATCLVVRTSHSKGTGPFAVIDIPTDQGARRTVASFSGTSVPPSIGGRLCVATVGPVNEITGEPDLVIRAELEPVWLDGGWKIKRRF